MVCAYIDLYADSKYAMNGITQWITGWKKKNWKTAAKKPVKNVDLWQKLDELNQKHRVSWFWVKGVRAIVVIKVMI